MSERGEELDSSVARGSRRGWRRLSAALVAVVVLLLIPVALWGRLWDLDRSTAATATPPEVEDTDSDGSATFNPSSPRVAPETPTSPGAPGVTDASGTEAPMLADVGEPLQSADGSVMRVNGVSFGAPAPEAPAVEVDVELCSGTEGLEVSPVAWWGVFADETRVHGLADQGDLATTTLLPGVCTRGTVVLEAPGATELQSILLVDPAGAEVARWSSGPSVFAGPPLEPTTTAATSMEGELVMLDAGESAIVRSTTAGDGVAAAEVEQCAGALPVTVSAEAWFAVTSDSRLVSATSASSTLPTSVVEPGQCASGSVQFDLPEGQSLSGVVLTGFVYRELARWDVEG